MKEGKVIYSLRREMDKIRANIIVKKKLIKSHRKELATFYQELDVQEILLETYRESIEKIKSK